MAPKVDLSVLKKKHYICTHKLKCGKIFLLHEIFFSKSRITARVKNINIHFSYCYNDKIRKKLGNCQKQSNKQTKIDSRSISKASKQSLLLLLLLLAIIFLLLLN